MAPTSSTTKRPDVRRLRTLSPYLDRLREWHESQPSREGGGRIPIGDAGIDIDAWERQQLREYLATGEEIAGLVVQGLALLLKGAADAARMCGDEVMNLDDLYSLQSELMLDAAMGRALLRETQVAVDRGVMTGEVDRAKRLSLFRHKLHRAAADVKAVISESEPASPDQLVVPDEEVPSRTPAPEPAPRRPALERPALTDVEIAEPAPSPVARPTRRRRRPPRPTATRTVRSAPSSAPPWTGTRLLAVAFAVVALTAAWFQFGARTASPATRSTAADRVVAAGAPVVSAVEVRPPSLYLTVDEDAWNGLGAPERWSLMQRISGDLASQGFKGAFVRLPDRRPVAQWLELRGIAILDPPEHPEVAGAAGTH